MKIRHIFAIVLLSSVAMTGCTGILDIEDPSAVTSQQTWNDPILAKAFLDKCYLDAMPTWGSSSGETDEARGTSEFLWGNLDTDTSEDIVEDRYQDLYKINTLLANIDTGNLEESVRNDIKGQALFLRAFVYYELVIRYGGMPLILAPQSREEAIVPREKTSVCVEQIYKDLDDAIALLPAKRTNNDVGRIVRGAASGLKGRMALYYASKQFNRSNDKQRWERAYTLNVAAKNQLDADGYGLHPSYKEIWQKETTVETILATRFVSPARTHNVPQGILPLEYSLPGANGTNQPTWEMANAFPMADGTEPGVDVDGDGIKEEFDPTATDARGLFWVNRDPRFYEMIVTNGMIYELDGNKWPEHRQFTYEGGENNTKTATGLYSNKYIMPGLAGDKINKSDVDWIEMRYAEILLNVAECAAQLVAAGDNSKANDVYECIKAIRKRAGITANEDGLYGLKANMSGEELVEAVMRERQIEFAFEGKRFWDMRRTGGYLQPKFQGYKRNILIIYRKSGSRYESMDKTELIPLFCENGEANLNTSKYFDFFETKVAPWGNESPWNVREEYYFYPLRKKHMEQNDLLKQTNGWNEGGFDPLL